MNENRVAPRLRALKAARIILPGGHSTFDCTVRNLSATGAKLIMETTIAVPERFTLRFEDGTEKVCEVAWRKTAELGVSFSGAA